MVGPTRARALVENRPFHSWEDVEQVPGFSKRMVEGMVDDLKKRGREGSFGGGWPKRSARPIRLAAVKSSISNRHMLRPHRLSLLI
jgi:hypothetical protein